MERMELSNDLRTQTVQFGWVMDDNGQMCFSVVLRDANNKIITWGAWPKADWERMKEENDKGYDKAKARFLS